MEIAVLDLGSTTFHLLSARVSEEGRLVAVGDWTRAIRLGQRTLQSGVIDESAWVAGMCAVEQLADRARGLWADRFAVVGTSVLREAENGAAFAEAASRICEEPVEVLSGQEEARLSYRGAVSGVSAAGRVGVVDIGGGSVEFSFGSDGRCVYTDSAPLGVVRLRDAFIPDRELEPDDVSPIVRLVQMTASPAASTLRALRPERVVFASGSARAVRDLALACDLDGARSDRVSLRALRQVCELSIRASRRELRLMGVPAGRVDTIAISAVVLWTLVEALGCDAALIGERGLREGVALREYERARVGRESPSPKRLSPRLDESPHLAR